MQRSFKKQRLSLESNISIMGSYLLVVTMSNCIVCSCIKDFDLPVLKNKSFHETMEIEARGGGGDHKYTNQL